MLVDANLLLYAVDRSNDRHEPAASWLTDVLNGTTRVGIPWQTIGAFLRIATHPRVTERPLAGPEAWTFVDAWLAADPAWIATCVPSSRPRRPTRTDMAEMRTELRTEMRDLTTGQTRTMMLGLVGSITALAVTQLIIAAL